MKVLYIGVYRDGTGWGQAATDYILAMDSVGIDVVPRHIKLNKYSHTPPAKIVELEKKSATNYDIVIQHVLPHMMEKNEKFCIGMFATETSNFLFTPWSTYLNMMDGLIVFNNSQIDTCLNSHINNKMQIVGHAFDMKRLEYNPKPVPEVFGDKFRFYTIGEFTRRKNFAALLMAFYVGFHDNPNVELVIKTGGKDIYNLINEIKSNLKIPNLPDPIIINRKMSDEEILDLHHACNCFVCPSYGEAWSIPTFDAMAFGKQVVATNCTGFRDYLNNSNAYLVKSNMEPVFGIRDTFPYLHTGYEMWHQVSITHLIQQMKKAFNSEPLAIQGVNNASSFSYEAIGNKMKAVLQWFLSTGPN